MSSLSITLALCQSIIYHDLASTREAELWKTFVAICWVESRGDPRAVGDGGLAVGIAQIHPILVQDVNRILGRQRYTLADRSSVIKSWEMFRIYSRFYHPRGTPEQWARAWNGGPSGPRKPSTLKYWHRVSTHFR